MTNEINYATMIDQAMRHVVRDVMRKVSGTGLPGEHHFFITFATQHPGVKISDALRTRYPNEMTIVLQHQFWDFAIDDHTFSVSLSFGGVPEKLTVPFAALTAFADPGVKFGLQFQHWPALPAAASASSSAGGAAAVPAPVQSYEDEKFAEEDSSAARPAEIISLDAFRKK
jgi:hypothetical protein